MANWAGLEPASGALTGRCSAIELPVLLAEDAGPTRSLVQRRMRTAARSGPGDLPCGAVGGIRTPMLLIRIQVLIRFSYDSVVPHARLERAVWA